MYDSTLPPLRTPPYNLQCQSGLPYGAVRGIRTVARYTSAMVQTLFLFHSTFKVEMLQVFAEKTAETRTAPRCCSPSLQGIQPRGPCALSCRVVKATAGRICGVQQNASDATHMCVTLGGGQSPWDPTQETTPSLLTSAQSVQRTCAWSSDWGKHRIREHILGSKCELICKRVLAHARRPQAQAGTHPHTYIHPGGCTHGNVIIAVIKHRDLGG